MVVLLLFLMVLFWICNTSVDGHSTFLAGTTPIGNCSTSDVFDSTDVAIRISLLWFQQVLLPIVLLLLLV